jgi:ribonuclease VapC
VSKIVIDTSVILAIINNEPGREKAEELLPNAVISSVNVAEVVSILTTKFEIPKDDVKLIIHKLIGEVINFTEDHAYIAGEFHIQNKQHKLNLSLGDRACLALAQYLKVPVYTADRPWKDLKLNKLDVRFIR